MSKITSKIKLTDKDDIDINPATNEKLDAVITAIENNGGGGGGGASVEESIQELVSRLSFLAAVRGTAADIRVTLLSGVLTSVGTVTTVTTVSTVSNQTNMGGYNAALPVIANVNMAAVLSNINNIY